MGGAPSASLKSGASEPTLLQKNVVRNTSFKYEEIGEMREMFGQLVPESFHSSMNEPSGQSFQSKRYSSRKDLKIELNQDNFNTNDAIILNNQEINSLAFSPEIDRNILDDAEAEQDALNKFIALNDGSINELILPKMKILDLVDWVLRLSSDFHKKNSIINIFTNCIEDNDGLTFEEFHLMYQEVAMRVELEEFYNIKYDQLDKAHNGCLDKNGVIILMDNILMEFAQILCTKREIVEMKKKLVRIFDNQEGGRLKRNELFEVFDGMLVSLRLIYKAKAKFAEYNESGQGLGEQELSRLFEWIIKSFYHSGIQINEEDKIDMQRSMLNRFDEDANGVLSLKELATLFETIMEKKKWFYSINSSIEPPRRKSVLKTRKKSVSLAVHAYIDISEHEQAAIGIPALAKQKFKDINRDDSGYLRLKEAYELLEWIHQSTPELVEAYKSYFKNGWGRQEEVNFDEFCSMFNEVKLSMEIENRYQETFAILSKDGVQIHSSLINELFDKVLLSAEDLGCFDSERTKILQKVVKRSAARGEFLTTEDLSDALGEISTLTRMMKTAGDKFRELDVDCSGVLEGAEIDVMAEWMLKATAPNRKCVPSSKQIEEARANIMKRARLPHDGQLSLREFAIFYEEHMRVMQSRIRTTLYKKKVECLIVEFLAQPVDCIVDD